MSLFYNFGRNISVWIIIIKIIPVSSLFSHLLVCVRVCVCVSESGIGAGIDSYYEYLLKAYIMLGDETFLDRFNKVSVYYCVIHYII